MGKDETDNLDSFQEPILSCFSKVLELSPPQKDMKTPALNQTLLDKGKRTQDPN